MASFLSSSVPANQSIGLMLALHIFYFGYGEIRKCEKTV
jgi:hypothetical protein